MNPHKRIAYKILSLARLPIPTLLRNSSLLLDHNTMICVKCQHIFLKLLNIDNYGKEKVIVI